MKISELYASAWDNAINETAYFVNNLDKSPNTYTKNDWIVLEPFAIVNQLEFDENGFLIEVPEESINNSTSVNASSVLKIKHGDGNVDTYEYRREDGQGSVYEPADRDNWWESYIVTPEGKLLSWSTQGRYYPIDNEFWIEDDIVESSKDCIKANLNYGEIPYSFQEGEFNKYDNEDWAYYISRELGLDEDDYEMLIHDINNLRANEWIDDGILDKLSTKALDAFKSFIHYNEDEEDEDEEDEEDELVDVHRIISNDVAAVTRALIRSRCWYKFDEDFDRILLLEDGLAALDAADIEYKEV